MALVGASPESGQGKGPWRLFANGLATPKSFAARFFAAFVILFLLWHEPLVLPRLDSLAQDYLAMRKAASVEAKGDTWRIPRPVMILIGEQSLKEMGQWPWPRDHHARLLEQLDGAGVVVFDMIMPERTRPEDDLAFANAVREHGRVVTSAYATRSGERYLPVYPYRELFDAAAGVGLVNALPDADGAVRRTQLFLRAGDITLPSLALASAQLLTPCLPVFSVQADGWRMHWEKPEDPAGSAAAPLAFPDLALDSGANARFLPCAPSGAAVFEYSDVLRGAVPAAVFEKATVLVGVSAAGATDVHRIAGGDFAPGVWLVTQALNGIVSGRVIRLLDAGPAFAVALALALVCMAAGFQRSIRIGGALVLGAVAVWAGAWAACFWTSLAFPPLAVPAAASVLLFMASAGWRFFQLEREWAVRTVPMEEILLLPRHGAPSAENEKSFEEYLHAAWPKIASLSPLALLAARAGGQNEAVRACLEEALAAGKRETGGEKDPGLVVVTHSGDASPRHRMLIPLPFAGTAMEYAVVGWERHVGMESLKSVAALVVAVARHYSLLEEQAKRQRMLLSTIRALSGAIDAKDPVTAGHSERVAQLGKRLAVWLGWEESAVEDVFFAGVLHDVGKIGVPDTVLNKPGKLGDDELAAMRRHPAKGAEIMLPIDLPEEVVRGILEHHERLDGRGYPGGLEGTNVSQMARVLKIADVYDALVSKRQYKEPWPVEKACDLLYSERGKEFDAHMVEVFLRHMAPPGWEPPGDI